MPFYWFSFDAAQLFCLDLDTIARLTETTNYPERRRINDISPEFSLHPDSAKKKMTWVPLDFRPPRTIHRYRRRITEYSFERLEDFSRGPAEVCIPQLQKVQPRRSVQTRRFTSDGSNQIVCSCVRPNEPSLEIMIRFVLSKLILQTRVRSHPVGLDVWFFIGPFLYFHTSCAQIAKALARLRGCAGSPDPSLVVYVISTII